MRENLEKDLDLSDSEKRATVYIKCDNCGANLTFDPETQDLKCMHCGSIKSFEKSNAVSEIFIQEGFNQIENWDSSSKHYKCENCGAIVSLASNDAATFCPYCQTSHIVQFEDLDGLKPNAIYPYTIVKDTAVTNAKKWAKKRLFAPKSFKKNIKIDNVHGIYEPSFTFDSNTFSSYEGKIGKRYTRVVGSGKNRRTETYISWRRISGTFDVSYDDVFINASSDYDENAFDKLVDFKYENIKSYSTNYLSGFMAKRHEKSIQDAWNDAKDKMDKSIRVGILSKYSYDVVSYLNVSTIHNNVTYKYVLIPVYQLNYKYGKKRYSIYVNGETGKVMGKTPVSPLKVILTALLGLAAILGLAFLYLNS